MSESANNVPMAMSTSALESKLRDLKDKSNKHSQLLTAKLASSQSGQNLLHIGTSLSTLPPDLHSLLTQLHPVLSSAEATEKQYLQRLERLVQCGNDIRLEERRVQHAKDCAELYQDLLAAETAVNKDHSQRRHIQNVSSAAADETSDGQQINGKLDHSASLERCAQTTLILVQDLKSSTDVVAAVTASKVVPASATSDLNLPSMRTPLEDDMERAQFMMKLAPRIRRLESDTVTALTYRLEEFLRALQERRKTQEDRDPEEEEQVSSESELLLMIGHCMRGLALLGRGNEVENIFARVAIMPLITSKMSMGRLDEGGPRGECAGLNSLLDDIVETVADIFGPVIRLSETMFHVGQKVHIDLITDGVWVPIATALMADAAIKMAIFSPGIASILQSNHVALDNFLSHLAERLLKESQLTKEKPRTNLEPAEKLYFCPTISAATIHLAQSRIYSHVKTAEFSKRWNLPIYYQLRFGDCCTRMNKAIELTRREGWSMEVFTGDAEVTDTLRNSVGFELSFFLELYDILLSFWRPDVILKPLTNRFLRGAVQLVGRSLAFIQDGMDGKLQFGGGDDPDGNSLNHNGGPLSESNGSNLPLPSRSTYSWGDSAPDVASVAWELAILEVSMSHDYVSTVCGAIQSGTNALDNSEIQGLVTEVLKEASSQIRPLVERAWNGIIVKLLTEKCSGPLAAVKGVVATYRMTNRPPPTQASPYVVTILRPLKEFSRDFSLRTPDYIGSRWKSAILTAVTDRYCIAVEELITTVQRTEVALQNRRARRAASGGMSDGDKVKLQLYLDFQAFCSDVKELGIDPSTIGGITKLRTLTEDAQKLDQIP
ncbi:protein of unknown function DUF3510 containing protein [Nitzschia inconspicua]|uniref:COG complex component COG2 C-terminal domain-containing protein n=1 Tax=Nitzschia inconspicua TaxID=303405 RepID=A0A9K3PQN8_9STRA|nr:protein of unknown function DUF3510 containing protein [Nitzschia inconspicua]